MGNTSPQKKDRIRKLINKYEKKFLEMFIEYGPVEMKEKLELSEQDWNTVFNYLVFEKNAVKACVMENADFIHDIFKNNGPQFVRELFEIEDNKYDEIWEYIMDYIGVSRGAMFEFVTNNSIHFRELIENGNPSKIRELLLIDNEKYIRVWENILDILLQSVCTKQYTYSMYEQGLRMFTDMYNIGRNHRSLNKYNTLEDLKVTDEKEDELN